jgi:vacuolar-type H+-ATPase subunit H
MEDQDVLQHLLTIESQAAALVDDAESEANKRLQECERQNRAHYEDEYRRFVEQFEAEYKERIEAVKAECRSDLEAYRNSLDSMPLDTLQFSALAVGLLIPELPLEEKR